MRQGFFKDIFDYLANYNFVTYSIRYCLHFRGRQRFSMIAVCHISHKKAQTQCLEYEVNIAGILKW